MTSVRSIPALLLLAALPVAVTGEDASSGSRVEEWTKLREAQEGHLEPYRAGWLERTLLGVEKAKHSSITRQNVWGFYPRIQRIAQGSRNALGARFWQPDIGDSRVLRERVRLRERQRVPVLRRRGRPHRPRPGGGVPERTVKTDDVYEP